MKITIGLIGAPGSGKDEVAKILIKNHGFVRFAFADEIKKGYFSCIGITEEEFKAARGTIKESVLRNGLWKYSKQKKISESETYFIDPVISNIKNLNKNVVISDVRTTIELNSLLDVGGQIVIIIRDYESDFKSGERYIHETGIYLKHLLGFPVIQNYGNLEGLEEKVDKIYNQFLLNGGINGPER